MSRSLNAVFLIRSLHLGGAERQLTLLLLALHAAGHQVRVAVYYPDGPFEEDLHAAGVPVVCLNKGGRWDLLPFFWRWVCFLRECRPDVVHGYLPMSNLLALLAKPFAGWPKVVWGIRSSGSDPAHYGWMGRLETWLENRLANWADLIICNSQRGLATMLQRGYPATRTVCVPNGVDCQRFTPDSQAGLLVRQQWGVPANMFLFGLVGRLVPLKNHQAFLQAAAPLLHAHADVGLVCVGSGSAEQLASLRQLAHTLGIAGRVFFPGAWRDMPGAYSALDVFVSASLTEGSPNVLGEAMACGCRVISTDVGDAAWLMRDLGELVAPGDVAALTVAMARVHAQRHAPIPAVRERVLEVFDVDALARNTLGHLSALLSK